MTYYLSQSLPAESGSVMQVVTGIIPNSISAYHRPKEFMHFDFSPNGQYFLEGSLFGTGSHTYDANDYDPNIHIWQSQSANGGFRRVASIGVKGNRALDYSFIYADEPNRTSPLFISNDTILWAGGGLDEDGTGYPDDWSAYANYRGVFGVITGSDSSWGFNQVITASASDTSTAQARDANPGNGSAATSSIGKFFPSSDGARLKITTNNKYTSTAPTRAAIHTHDYSETFSEYNHTITMFKSGSGGWSFHSQFNIPDLEDYMVAFNESIMQVQDMTFVDEDNIVVVYILDDGTGGFTYMMPLTFDNTSRKWRPSAYDGSQVQYPAYRLSVGNDSEHFDEGQGISKVAYDPYGKRLVVIEKQTTIYLYHSGSDWMKNDLVGSNWARGSGASSAITYAVAQYYGFGSNSQLTKFRFASGSTSMIGLDYNERWSAGYSQASRGRLRFIESSSVGGWTYAGGASNGYGVFVSADFDTGSHALEVGASPNSDALTVGLHSYSRTEWGQGAKFAWNAHYGGDANTFMYRESKYNSSTTTGANQVVTNRFPILDLNAYPASNPSLNSSVSEIVGVAGGTIKAGGTTNSPTVTVTVGNGDLGGNTNLTAAVVSTAAAKTEAISAIRTQAGSAGANLVGDIIRLTPHGTEFNSAVQVQFVLDSAPADLTIWKRDSVDGDYSQWYQLPSNLWSNSGTTVTINTTRFSEYAGIGGINVARSKISNSQLAALTTTGLVHGSAIQISGSNSFKNRTVAAADLFLIEDQSNGTTYHVSASQMAEYFGGLVNVSSSGQNVNMKITMVTPSDTTDVGLEVDAGLLFNPSSDLLTVSGDISVGDDLLLASDSAVLSLGAGADATLTHDGTTGLTIAATPISIDSTGELHLNSTTGDIKLQDGGVDQIVFDLDGTAGEVIMKPGVDSDDLVIAQYDGTEVIRIEDDGAVDFAGGAGSSGVTITAAGQLTADGRVIVDDATDATSTTDGSLQTDGGLSVAKDVIAGNDVKLLSDSAVLSLGAGSDATFTHDGTTGLTIAATPISIDSTGELHLNSTTGDIKLQDGGVDQIAFDLDGTAGEVIMKPAVDSDDLVFAQYDGTEVIRIEDNGDVDFAGGAGSSGVTVSSAGAITIDGISTLGATTGATVSAAGILNVNNTTDATSTTDGSLQTDGGLSVAKDVITGNDVYLLNDSAVLGLGAGKDVTLTHDGGTGATLASAGAFVLDGAAAVTMDSDATMTIGAAILDINVDGGAGSGLISIDTTDTTQGITIGTATEGVPISIGHGTSEVTVNDNLTVTGDLTINGATTTVSTTNLQVEDALVELSDGASGAPANDQGFIFNRGASANAALIWDESADMFKFANVGSASADSTGNLSIASTFPLSASAFHGDGSGLTGVGAQTLAHGVNNNDQDLLLTFVSGAASASKFFFDAGLLFNPSTSLLTTPGNIKLPNDGQLGTVGDPDAIAISNAGVVTLSATTEASAIGTAALVVAGGASVAKDLYVGDDLELDSDSAKIGFGADSDVSLTHVADTGLLLNSSRQLQFGDSGTYIHQSADGVLDLVSDTEIEINATTIDINGAIDASSTITAAGRVIVDDATDATSTTDGSLQTDGGLSVAKDAVLGNDVKLLSDSAVLSMGAGNDITFTHDGTTGLTIAATPISIDSTGELHLNSTTGDIKLQDGGVDQIAFDLDGTAGEVIMKPAVDSDDLVFAQYDGTEVIRIEDNGAVDFAGGAGSSGVTITAAGQLTADGRVIVDDATDATSTTDGSLQTDGGLSVAKDAVLGNDVKLLSDAAVLNFGADSDVSVTHVADTGLLLNSSRQLQFGDSGTYIHQSADGVLDLVSDTEIEINATTIDINGAVDMSSTLKVGTIADMTADSNDGTHYFLVTDSDENIVKKESMGDMASEFADAAGTKGGIKVHQGKFYVAPVEQHFMSSAANTSMSGTRNDGAAAGANVTASLSSTPLSGSLMVFLNGLLQTRSGSFDVENGSNSIWDYKLDSYTSPTKVIMADALDSDDVLIVRYIQK